MNATKDIIVGIDLGTTNSLVAWSGPAGPEVIDDGSGPMLPSVVAYDEAGSVTRIGREARAHAVEEVTEVGMTDAAGRDLDDGLIRGGRAELAVDGDQRLPRHPHLPCTQPHGPMLAPWPAPLLDDDQVGSRMLH